MSFLKFLGNIFRIKKRYMGMRIGYFDPIQLSFNILNQLMIKGFITYDDAFLIIKNSLPPEMSEEEKTKVIGTLLIKK